MFVKQKAKERRTLHYPTTVLRMKRYPIKDSVKDSVRITDALAHTAHKIKNTRSCDRMSTRLEGIDSSTVDSFACATGVLQYSLEHTTLEPNSRSLTYRAGAEPLVTSSGCRATP